MNHSASQTIIEAAFEQRSSLDLPSASAELRSAVSMAIELLDTGQARVAEKTPEGWVVNQWLKKAVLLHFGIERSMRMPAGLTDYYDKVPLKYQDWTAERFASSGTRVVPGAIVRRGAYVASSVVLMPSFVNIGAFVDSGTMVDTWATVGSCAQIGRNVHLSGGVGIGGVLEPVQAGPTIIEDNCFIGARSEIVEGVVVEEGAVISMGVFIGQSTRIYDRARDEVLYGRVPAGAVVVSGTLPSDSGRCQLYCAVIVKRVDAKTRAKVSLNELLRSD
ncbi:MAG: 2,3,4,5-tetrahydropyridine-2,6-dicarboxylate N-succinyltransferase [Gammaproteobacteria bacterium]|nr:2,3,4,5-tetrahydropyridine-2,6-dicarboxylate N-succinyltransferase [Gammaproteobacteria bacterium]